MSDDKPEPMEIDEGELEQLGRSFRFFWKKGKKHAWPVLFRCSYMSFPVL